MKTSMTRRGFVSGACVAAAGLGLAGCDSGTTKKEEGEGTKQVGGSMTMYTPNSETLVNTVIPAFEEATGIMVDLIQAGTGELFKKLQSEASKPIADVVWGGAYNIYLSNEDLFEKYTSTENDNVIEQYRNTNGFCTYYCLDGSVLLLNKDLTKGMNITGYADLLRDDLKDKIISADPSNSSSAFAQLTNMLIDMGGYESDQAWDYVKQVFTLVNGKIATGSSNVYKTVADGENAVGLSYEDPCVRLLIDGANVDVVYPTEGTVFLPANTGIIKGANNMEQAKAWIDFIVSQPAQNIIARETTARPVRTDVEMNPNMKPIDKINIKEEDMKYVASHKDEIISRYTKIFTDIQNNK